MTESKHLNKILTKMFKYVGLTYADHKEYVKQDGWFSNYTWTLEQQEEFKQWFIDYLIKNPSAQKELYNGPVTKAKYKQADRAAWFILAYGWKTQ